MANAFYTEGLRQLVEGTIDWSSDDIRCVLVTSGYTYSAAHSALSSVGSQISGAKSTSALSGCAFIDITNGVAFDVSDFSFSSVGSGSTVDAAIFYFESTGTEAARVPLIYIDTDSGSSAISVATDGNNINVTIPATGVGQITVS